MVALQALPKCQQSSYTPIAILKRMDSLKLHVEVQNIIKLYTFYSMVFCK